MENLNIVIASSGQPSSNPRMVKEAVSLNNSGNKVTVVYCPMTPWGDKFDEDLFTQFSGIKWILVGPHPQKNRIWYFCIRLRRRLWKLIYNIVGHRGDIVLKVRALYSQELEYEILKHKADLYIGHNIGSINAVIKGAKKYNSFASFDFEDFHRGESLYQSQHWNDLKLIEDKYVPHLDFATAASPLIRKFYVENYPNLICETILNTCVRIPNLRQISSFTQELRIFWFSQNISFGRGLELLIQALGKLRGLEIKITLLGNILESAKKDFYELCDNFKVKPAQIEFFNPVSPQEIFNISVQHHIGFAAEVPATLNRDICLTNKIFTYVMSGNSVLMSNTNAQINLLKKYPNIGLSYDIESVDDLTKKIEMYYNNRILLDFHRQSAQKIALEELNWEVEEVKLLNFYEKQITPT
jgi:hypothetical protein